MFNVLFKVALVSVLIGSSFSHSCLSLDDHDKEDINNFIEMQP